MLVIVMVVVVVPVMVVLGEGLRRLRKVNAGFGHFAEIGARFVLFHNCHTVSELLVEISFDD